MILLIERYRELKVTRRIVPTNNPNTTTPLSTRRRSPSSLSLIAGALVLALLAVMAIPVLDLFLDKVGISISSEIQE